MYTAPVKPRANNPFFGSEPGGRKAALGPLALVQAFVNTREVEHGREMIADPGSLQQWLVRQGLLTSGEPVGTIEVRRTREVREALRALLVANNGGELNARAVETLNRAAVRTRLEVRFGVYGRSSLGAVTGGVDGALGRILVAVHAGMENGKWERLKACANEECRWAFYDRSKNRSGQWCSMAVCGNRIKTRAYRRRRTETR